MNPVIRFSLLIGEGLEVTGTDGKTYSSASGWIDVTSEVSSWDETEITRQRDGLTAVVTEVASPVVFCDGRDLANDFSAYVLLKRLFEKYGLHALAKMRVEERDDADLDAYTVLHEFDLDFQHYEWEDGKVTLDGTSPALQQALKSRGGTKYDIPVSELYPYKFKYSPIQIQSTASYEIPGEPEFATKFGIRRELAFPIEIYFSEVDTVEDHSVFLCQGQNTKLYRNRDGGNFNDIFTGQEFFLRNETGKTQHARVKGHVSATAYFKIPGLANAKVSGDSYLKIEKFNNGSYEDEIFSGKLSIWDDETGGSVSANIDAEFDLLPGEVASMYMWVKVYDVMNNPADDEPPTIAILTAANSFNVTWSQTSGESITFDITTPATLLGKLLQKISPEGQRFTGSIDFSTLQRTIMLAAAESIRGIEGAKFHTSLNDFIRWMETLGFGYEIDGTVLRFAPLATFFDKSKEGIALSEASDVKVEASGDYAYTSLKIGYDKVDYENLNGRYEVNGTFEYTTGYTSNEDNVLELISPYRADHYGIEFLTWERWKDSTDDQSDNDVFVLACAASTEGGYYVFDKEPFYLVDGISFYNASLCPATLANENAPRLGIITGNLAFASTTNNRNAKWAFSAGTASNTPYDDLELTGGLFSPFLYKITVGLVESTDIKDYGGIITFPCIDETGEEVTKKGFIKEASRSVRKEKAEEWTLYAVED